MCAWVCAYCIYMYVLPKYCPRTKIWTSINFKMNHFGSQYIHPLIHCLINLKRHHMICRCNCSKKKHLCNTKNIPKYHLNWDKISDCNEAPGPKCRHLAVSFAPSQKHMDLERDVEQSYMGVMFRCPHHFEVVTFSMQTTSCFLLDVAFVMHPVEAECDHCPPSLQRLQLKYRKQINNAILCVSLKICWGNWKCALSVCHFSVCLCSLPSFLPMSAYCLSHARQKSQSDKTEETKYWSNQNNPAEWTFCVCELFLSLQTTNRGIIWRGQCCPCCICLCVTMTHMRFSLIVTMCISEHL